MESVLIVSYTDNGAELFSEMLNAVFCAKITTVHSASESRRLLLEQDFDLVMINAPLRDETGESLSRHIAAKGICQVMLFVKSEFYEEISAATEDYGVMTLPKPINKNVFWSALKLAKSARNKMRILQNKNNELTLKIEEIRIIDRAKCILISHLGMSEQDAHRYIEKQSMDMRATRRAISDDILKTYDN